MRRCALKACKGRRRIPGATAAPGNGRRDEAVSVYGGHGRGSIESFAAHVRRGKKRGGELGCRKREC